MTTTEAPISQAELNIILAFFKKHNIAWIGADGNKNGTVFGELFDQWSGTGKTIPFTQQSLETAFRKLQEAGSLIFYSADETQYHIYEEQYPAELETIRRFLPTYSLSVSVEDESLYVNTNIIMEYCITTGRVHQITQTNLQRLIGNLHTIMTRDERGNLVSRPGVSRSLRWIPTPNQQAAAKRWEATRASESTKSPLEIAKEKAATVAHIMNPDGTRMSDQIMREFYEAHREALEPETPTKTPAQETAHRAESYWKGRVKDYIGSLSGHNVLQQEAEQRFGREPLHNSWRETFNALHNFVQSKRVEKPGLWA